ncbi:MAG: lysophospholipid acyltransferase family protein, partial [Bacteroidales bacterium]|nr:lysophospholipid acyltransferase family protein [Bacteroidales bacterium]
MNVIFFLYQWLVFVPLFLLWSIVFSLITYIGCALSKNPKWGYIPGMIWAKGACLMALCPVTVKGRENLDPNTSYIFVANHQGAFDIMLLFGHLGHPFRWMLRKGLKKLPFVGKACDKSGQIWVDERGSSGLMHTVRQAMQTLKGGTSVIVFPEGTRTATGHMNRFKQGAFTLAAMLRLPVVPVTLDGPYQVMKKGSKQIRPHRMTLTIHAPLPAVTKAEGTEAGIDRLLHDSQRIIAESLGEEVK